MASAIGFEVLYNDLRAIPVEQRHGATPVSIERLFAESDVLTLHIDGRPSNRHAVNASLIASMKSDAVVLRAFFRTFNLLDRPDALLADADVGARIFAAWETRDQREPEAPLGPSSRSELLERIAA